MNLKQLEYLEAVYRLHSITKAANEQFISQPSISSSIQQLESELGVTLINRNTRPLKFTKAGEEFMFYVNRALNDLSTAVASVRKGTDEPKETLVMGLAGNANDWLLPKIYVGFKKSFREYELFIEEDTLEHTMKKVSSGKSNLAYTLLPDNYDLNEFELVPVQQCQLQVLLNKQHPLAQYTSITPEQLSDEVVVMYSKGSLIREKLDDLFMKAHIYPNYYTINRASIIQSFVEENEGVGFVVTDHRDLFAGNDKIVIRPLSTPIYVTRGFVLKKGARRTSATNAMIHYIQQIIAEDIN